MANVFGYGLTTIPTLEDGDVLNIYDAIRNVVNTACKVNANSEQFPSDWLFFYRENKKDKDSNGRKIEYEKVAGRTAAYTPANLERLPGAKKRRRTSKANL
eukprot:GHVO01068686.1.p1 GENE.GHVO01068686.1~~GHVO01068686.1.p1  ORF type:complete len:101 (+),score=15.15 GHVO01068686.1:130-432(+)